MADCQKITCCPPSPYGYEISRGNPNLPPLTSYQLDIIITPSDSGTVTGEGVYQGGGNATISATPATGFTFVKWSGDYAGTQNPAQVFMNSSKSISAEFAVQQVALSVTIVPIGGGTVTGDGVYDYGDVAAITATPSANFDFLSFSGDLNTTDNPANITMDGNKAVTANFNRPNYTISLSDVPAGSSTLYGAGIYPKGTVVQIQSVPNLTSTEFLAWSGDESSVDNPLSVTVDSDKTIVANLRLCLCDTLSVSYLLHTPPTSTVFIKDVTPSPDGPPQEGYERRKACFRWVCACVGSAQKVISIQQYGDTASGLDLTTLIWQNTPIPSVPGCYIYRFEFFGWRGPFIDDETPRGWISSDSKYTLTQQRYAGIN
jgi:hypothetical protein